MSMECGGTEIRIQGGYDKKPVWIGEHMFTHEEFLGIVIFWMENTPLEENDPRLKLMNAKYEIVVRFFAGPTDNNMNISKLLRLKPVSVCSDCEHKGGTRCYRICKTKICPINGKYDAEPTCLKKNWHGACSHFLEIK